MGKGAVVVLCCPVVDESDREGEGALKSKHDGTSEQKKAHLPGESTCRLVGVTSAHMSCPLELE